MQDAIDAGTYEPSDALTFAKYADRPDVIDAVLADNYRSGSDLDWRPDPTPRPLDDLDLELARLQRRYRTASHEVGERGARPDGINDASLAWWVAAHGAKWRRRFERSDRVAITEPVEQVQLRTNDSASRHVEQEATPAGGGSTVRHAVSMRHPTAVAHDDERPTR